MWQSAIEDSDPAPDSVNHVLDQLSGITTAVTELDHRNQVLITDRHNHLVGVYPLSMIA